MANSGATLTQASRTLLILGLLGGGCGEALQESAITVSVIYFRGYISHNFKSPRASAVYLFVKVNEEQNKILSLGFIKEGKHILFIVKAFNLMQAAELHARYNCTHTHTHRAKHYRQHQSRMLKWDWELHREAVADKEFEKKGTKLVLRAGVAVKPGFLKNSLEGRMGQLHKAIEKCNGPRTDSSQEDAWGFLLLSLNFSVPMFPYLQKRSVNALQKCLFVLIPSQTDKC